MCHIIKNFKWYNARYTFKCVIVNLNHEINTFQIESILAQTFYVFDYTQTQSNKELKPKWHGWITLEEFQIDMLIN